MPTETPTDEQTALQNWTSATSAAKTPEEFARAGGAAATDFPWIFMAGYQAAIREVFQPGVNGWLAYAATEDRNDTLPGLSISDGALYGSKTWVAGSDSVSHLVTTLRGDHGRRYFLVPRSGVRLERRPGDDRFLGALSQGIAHFEGTRDHTELHPENVRAFASAEARYVHLAYRAHVTDTFPDLPQPTDILKLLDAHENALDVPPDNWQRDKRVIEMYVKRQG